MKLVSLKMINFMNHIESTIDFSMFSSALIVGKKIENDRISNGTGKSTICHAIEYAFYNKVHRVNLEKVVRDGAKKCIVEIEFIIGGNLYKIHRSRTPKGATNVYFYENGESISQRTPSETEMKIHEIIKINHKAFQYSILFRQADLTGLTEESDGSEAEPKIRKEVLKEPMNLVRYSKKEEMTKKLMKPIKDSISAKQLSLTVLGDPASEIKEAKKSIVEIEKLIVANQESLSGNQKVLEEKRTLLVDLKSSIVNDSAIVAKILNQEKIVKGIESTINKLKGSLKAKREESVKCLDIITKTTKDLEANRNRVMEVKQKSFKDTSLILNDISKAVEAINKGTQLVAKAEAEIDNANGNIPNDDKCPVCRQDITKEYRTDAEKKSEILIESKRNDIKRFSSIIEKAKRDKEAFEKDIALVKEFTAELSSTQKFIENYSNQLLHQQSSYDRLHKDIIDSELEIEKSEQEYSEMSESLQSLKKSVLNNNVDVIQRQVDSLAADITRIESKIKELQEQFTNLKIKESALSQKIKTRSEDDIKAKEIQSEIDSLKKKLSLHQIVSDSFSHRGIPTQIINTCLEELQLETNKALQELRPDLDVRFDSDLNFTYRRNGAIREYHQLSYGQHVYIALALKRGLSTVIQKKLDVDIRFMLFDEVDSSLDEEGLRAFSAAIKKWQNQFTILVITHNKDLKEEFGHAILVEEGPEGSTAKVVTSW